MLCIMYTTTISGPEKTTLSEITEKIPEDIWKIVDKFLGTNGVYKEVGHLKPGMHLREKMFLLNENKKIISYATIATFFTVGLGKTFFKILSTQSRKSSKKFGGSSFTDRLSRQDRDMG